jgi:hypothetical protein
LAWVNPVGNKTSPSCSQCCNKKTWRCYAETGMRDHERNRKTGDQTGFCTNIGAKTSLSLIYFRWKKFAPVVHFIPNRAQTGCSGPQSARFYR